MSEPRRERNLYPYQVAALDDLRRYMAALPIGQPLLTTALIRCHETNSSSLWVEHRRP